MMLAASVLAGVLTVVVFSKLHSANAEAAVVAALADGDKSILPDNCSSTVLTAGPTSGQLSCLSDVQQEFGTLDCSAPQGFEVRLKADVVRCETKVKACLTDNAGAQLKAASTPTSNRKITRIVKREPAKMVQLGRAQPAAETRSYLIQCDTEPQIHQ